MRAPIRRASWNMYFHWQLPWGSACICSTRCFGRSASRKTSELHSTRRRGGAEKNAEEEKERGAKKTGSRSLGTAFAMKQALRKRRKTDFGRSASRKTSELHSTRRRGGAE